MLLATPYIGLGAGGGATPASFTFNGIDEALVRTLTSVSPSTTLFTYSAWVKIIAVTDVIAPVWSTINAPTNTLFCFGDLEDAGQDGVFEGLAANQDDGTADWGSVGATSSFDLNEWHHCVWRYDSPNATADDRLREYQNGTLLIDVASAAGEPALNEAHALFTATRQHQIGAQLDVGSFLSGKLAFIDVIDGLSLDPGEFAFNQGGIWTRKPYLGSYGANGWSLNNTQGFARDTSGNEMHFTGQNMDDSNLDFVDLPPWI